LSIRQRTSSSRSSAPAVLSDGLLLQIFRRISHERGRGLVVAVTSVDRKAGVTFISEHLAEQLGADNGGSAVSIESCVLTEVGAVDGNAIAHPSAISHALAVGNEEDAASPWCDSYNQRKAILARLRATYQYTLIACPPIRFSPEILGIADLVDGVVLVVEANRTQQRQIAVTEKTIMAVGGSILGNVLNKRAYFIPEWLFSMLARFNI
jgi:hypothetical protein